MHWDENPTGKMLMRNISQENHYVREVGVGREWEERENERKKQIL